MRRTALIEGHVLAALLPGGGLLLGTTRYGTTSPRRIGPQLVSARTTRLVSCIVLHWRQLDDTMSGFFGSFLPLPRPSLTKGRAFLDHNHTYFGSQLHIFCSRLTPHGGTAHSSRLPLAAHVNSIGTVSISTRQPGPSSPSGWVHAHEHSSAWSSVAFWLGARYPCCCSTYSSSCSLHSCASACACSCCCCPCCCSCCCCSFDCSCGCACSCCCCPCCCCCSCCCS